MDSSASSHDRRRGRTVSRERGAAGWEYIGMIVVAALVTGSITLAISGAGVPQAVCEAVGSIMRSDAACGNSGGGDDQAEGQQDPQTAPLDDEFFKPDSCKLNESSERTNSKVKIFFIEIGEDAGFVVTEFSDGTVKMTATNGGSIGATGGIGADASFGALEAGAKVDFGAGVKFDYGSTWTFDSMAEAEAMREQLDKYLVQQYQIRNPPMGPMGPIPVIIFNPVDPPKPPTEVVSSVAAFAEIKGTLGVDLVGQTPGGRTLKIPESSVVAQLTGESKWVVRTNTETGDTTYVTQLQLNGSASGQIWLATYGFSQTDSAAMSITKDSEGRITAITFITTSEGSLSDGGKVGGSGSSGDDKAGGSIGGSTTDSTASVVTTTLTLDPDSPSDQQIARDWLGGDTDYSWAGAISANNINPSSPVEGDAFQNLMYERARVSAVTYDKVTDATKFGLNVKLGFALGFDFSLESSESTAVEASYMGAPNTTPRPVLPLPECVG